MTLRKDTEIHFRQVGLVPFILKTEHTRDSRNAYFIANTFQYATLCVDKIAQDTNERISKVIRSQGRDAPDDVAQAASSLRALGSTFDLKLYYFELGKFKNFGEGADYVAPNEFHVDFSKLGEIVFDAAERLKASGLLDKPELGDLADALRHVLDNFAALVQDPGRMPTELPTRDKARALGIERSPFARDDGYFKFIAPSFAEKPAFAPDTAERIAALRSHPTFVNLDKLHERHEKFNETLSQFAAAREEISIPDFAAALVEARDLAEATRNLSAFKDFEKAANSLLSSVIKSHIVPQIFADKTSRNQEELLADIDRFGKAMAGNTSVAKAVIQAVGEKYEVYAPKNPEAVRALLKIGSPKEP
ncbi:MAG: hypothetical protein ACLP7P_20380 [Rhodomicrobium sp.]